MKYKRSNYLGEKMGNISRLNAACLQMTLSYFNKNDESVKQSFDNLTIYEKDSGSKVNYEKTKGMYIGSAKHNRPKFPKLVSTKDNVKSLGFIMVIIYKIMRYGNQ